jgi:hypothetical protein
MNQYLRIAGHDCLALLENGFEENGFEEIEEGVLSVVETFAAIEVCWKEEDDADFCPYQIVLSLLNLMVHLAFGSCSI